MLKEHMVTRIVMASIVIKLLMQAVMMWYSLLHSLLALEK